MNIIYGTQARISIRNDAGEWVDIGEASLVETEMTLDDIAPLLFLPRSFEIECAVTWVDPWALALPPAGMMPMYN